MNLQSQDPSQSSSPNYKLLDTEANEEVALQQQKKNKLFKKQTVNIPPQDDFLEQNLALMNKAVRDEEFKTLWNEPELTDPMVILEGKRAHFIKQRLVIGKETNLISSGLLCQHETILYVGCKDGSIRNIQFISQFFDQSKVLKKWYPHLNAIVRQMSICQGKLFTNSNTNELKIFDIENWNETESEQPECLFTIEDVLCFEIRQKGDNFKLSYCKENALCSLKITDEMNPNNAKSKDIQENKDTELVCYTKEQGIILCDRANIYQQTGTDTSIIQERPSTSKVKCLFVEGTNLVSVISDSLSQDTVIQIIDLNPPPVQNQSPGHPVELALDDEEDYIMKQSTLLGRGGELGQDQKINKSQRQQFTPVPSLNGSKLIGNYLNAKVVSLMGSKSGSRKGSVSQMKKEQQVIQEEEHDEKDDTVRSIPLEGTIGECSGVYKAHTHKSGKSYYIVTGTKGIAVMKGDEIIHKIKTEYVVAMAILSQDQKHIILLGTDGRIRSIQWTSLKSSLGSVLKESDVNECVSSPDGRFFAVLSKNQTLVTIYKYSSMQCIQRIQMQENIFLVNFAANSKILMLVYNDPMDDEQNREMRKTEVRSGGESRGTAVDKTYIVQMISLDSKNKTKYQPWKISLQDYPYQVDSCDTLKMIYVLTLNVASKSSSLYLYNYFAEKPNKMLKNIETMTLSPDEKMIAYSDNAGTIFLTYLSTWEIVNEIKLLQQNNEMPKSLQFFQRQKILVVQTAAIIYGINVYTHKVEFKIIHSSFQSMFDKVSIIQEELIAFVDSTRKLCIYDITSKYPGSECRVITDTLANSKLNISKRYGKQNNIPWLAIGNHLIMALENSKQLLFEKNPFLHHGFTMEDCFHSPFSSIDGFYIPVLMGGPIMSTGSFADIYVQALEDAESGSESEQLAAIQTLLTPVYPFKLNALHYFAMTHNVKGAEFCFKKRVRWVIDIFGKSPFDYALKSNDRQIMETVIQGLFETEYEDREAVMRQLPLTVLLKYAAVYLPPLLREAGSSVPDDSMYCGVASPPRLFPLKKMVFGESNQPIYDLQVAKQLHDTSKAKKKQRSRAIYTTVLNNPVPVSYCDDSLDLLSAIIECKSDEVVRSKPITLYLNRKWNSFAYKFYLTNLCLFITLLLSLTFVEAYKDPYIHYTLFGVACVINVYFFLYECVQICIQKLNYFKDAKNLMDLTRLTLIFMIIYSKSGINEQIPPQLMPLTFFLMWAKILSYLSVFKPTRYLIKMIFEIIGDILTFLIILFTAIFAYAQINYSIVMELPEGETKLPFYDELRMSYTLAFGELGEFMANNLIKFFIFAVFSFFIPLVLLNMLIALMADSYTRVQTNAIAADCRALAELELEMEELVFFFYSWFKPELLENKYYYCFCSNINEGDDDDEGWEGTVGQLKTTIKEQSDELKAKLTDIMNEQIKEKTNDVIDRIVKTNTETQSRIDQTQKLVEKESLALNEKIEAAEGQVKKVLSQSQDMEKKVNTITSMCKEQDVVLQSMVSHQGLIQTKQNECHVEVKDKFNEIEVAQASHINKVLAKMIDQDSLSENQFKTSQNGVQKIQEQLVQINTAQNNSQDLLITSKSEILQANQQLSSKVDANNKQALLNVSQLQQSITGLDSSSVKSFEQVNQTFKATSVNQESLLGQIRAEVKSESVRILEEHDKKTSSVLKLIDDVTGKETETLLTKISKLCSTYEELELEQKKCLQGINNFQKMHETNHQQVVGMATNNMDSVKILFQKQETKQDKEFQLLQTEASKASAMSEQIIESTSSLNKQSKSILTKVTELGSEYSNFIDSNNETKMHLAIDTKEKCKEKVSQFQSMHSNVDDLVKMSASLAKQNKELIAGLEVQQQKEQELKSIDHNLKQIQDTLASLRNAEFEQQKEQLQSFQKMKEDIAKIVLEQVAVLAEKEKKKN